MIDLTLDARERLARDAGRAQTHSDICHRWHDACLIARLVKRCEAAEAEADRLRSLVRFQDGVIRSGDTATLTTAERTAIKTALVYLKEDEELPGIAEDKATLRGLLERMG